MARNNRNNLEKHVFSDRVKWGVTVLCILLIGVFLAAACTQGFTNGNPWGWFDKKEETEDVQVDAGGGGIAAPVEDDVQTMSLAVTKISPEEYGDYGIMPIADTAFTIKASYTSSVTFKELDWAIKWKSGVSGQWGNGKTVTEYATISPSPDTLTLTLTVKQAFGEQIIITATNRVNPSCTKSATVDYAKRVMGITGLSYKGAGGNAVIYQLGNEEWVNSVVDNTSTDTITSFTANYIYSSVYTVDDTFNVVVKEIAVNLEWSNLVKIAVAQHPLYKNNNKVKAAIDAMDLTGTYKAFTTMLDFTEITNIYNMLFGSAAPAVSDTTTRAQLKQLLAYAFSEEVSSPQGYDYEQVFRFRLTIKGKYSEYTPEDEICGIVYGYTPFGTVAAAGSLNFDKAAFVA